MQGLWNKSCCPGSAGIELGEPVACSPLPLGRGFVDTAHGRLPLPARSVDKIATNLPFGKQIGSPETNPVLYARFFEELVRVLSPGGRAVLLTSEKDLMRELIHRHRELALDQQILVGLLGQSARIYVLHRT